MAEKKECLCADGTAPHEVFFKKFLESGLDSAETVKANEVICHLRKYPSLSSRDLENILYFVTNSDTIPSDEATVQLLACLCLRSVWKTSLENAGLENEYEYDDFVVQSPCATHLVCMIREGEDSLANDFIGYVTDDSC